MLKSIVTTKIFYKKMLKRKFVLAVLEGYYPTLNGRLTLRPSLNAYQKGNIQKNQQLVNTSDLDQHINHVLKLLVKKVPKWLNLI